MVAQFGVYWFGITIGVSVATLHRGRFDWKAEPSSFFLQLGHLCSLITRQSQAVAKANNDQNPSHPFTQIQFLLILLKNSLH